MPTPLPHTAPPSSTPATSPPTTSSSMNNPNCPSTTPTGSSLSVEHAGSSVDMPTIPSHNGAFQPKESTSVFVLSHQPTPQRPLTFHCRHMHGHHTAAAALESSISTADVRESLCWKTRTNAASATIPSHLPLPSSPITSFSFHCSQLHLTQTMRNASPTSLRGTFWTCAMARRICFLSLNHHLHLLRCLCPFHPNRMGERCTKIMILTVGGNLRDAKTGVAIGCSSAVLPPTNTARTAWCPGG